MGLVGSSVYSNNNFATGGGGGGGAAIVLTRDSVSPTVNLMSKGGTGGVASSSLCSDRGAAGGVGTCFKGTITTGDVIELGS